MINKYNIGDKVRTKIHYTNDTRKEVEAVIHGVELDGNIIKYKIYFNANEYDKEFGCTGCKGYVREEDILELCR